VPRVYRRRFDWDQAHRLRSDGWSYGQIARVLGVTTGAVRQACDEEYRLAVLAAVVRFQTSGVCSVCGARCSRNRSTQTPICRSCSLDNLATSVDDDALRCTKCNRWLPDEDFAFVSPGARHRRIRRRGRRHYCRSCESKARAERRRRNQSETCVDCGVVCMKPNARYPGERQPRCRSCWQAFNTARLTTERAS
jgi:hypothetical protein